MIIHYLKQVAPIFFLHLYLLRDRYRIAKLILNNSIYLFYLVFLVNGWRTKGTMISYALLTTVLYLKTLQVTKDRGFSFIFTINAVMVSAYIYEIPRWLIMNENILRFSKYSPFIVHYNVIAIPILIYFLDKRGFKPRAIHLVTSLIFMAFLIYYPELLIIRKKISYSGLMAGIVFLRMPTMLLIASIPFGFNLDRHSQ